MAGDYIPHQDGAFFHYRYDSPMEDMENKYIRLGFDRAGNLLEIM
jgi:hypothetical protein